MPSSSSTPADRLGREVWIVSGVVVLGVIMSILDTTIVNVALDTLAHKLHSTLNTVQWFVTGYLLALAVVIPLTGWMTERFGAKRVWITSVVLFGAGSALCGISASAGELIVFRVLQGIGGGMIMPVGMSVLAQTAGPQRVGRVMSVIGVPMLLAPILGPVLGGLIVDNTTWRLIFYVNVPIAILAVALAWRLLSSSAGRADAGRLDWRGLALLSPGLGGLVFGLSEIETQGGIAHPIALGPILAGLALVAAFALHAWRAKRPLIDVRLFSGAGFSSASATTFLLGGALFGAMIILPLYYQLDRGASALTAGLLLAPQGLGAALVMPLSGTLTDRVGGGRVAIFGLIVMTLGTVPFAFLGAHTSEGLLAGFLVVRGIGMGFSMMPAMAAAYATLEHAAVPRATATLNALQRIGGSVGTAVLAVVLEHQIKVQLGSHAATGGGLPSIPPAARARVAEPLATAFANTFWWAIAASAIALVPALLLARAEHRDRAAGRAAQRNGRIDLADAA